MGRLQALAWQAAAAAQPSAHGNGNGGVVAAACATHLPADSHHHQQQQQQQYAAALADLRLQLHKLLLAHLTREVTHWRGVARVLNGFQPYLNPRVVAGALLALQQQHMLAGSGGGGSSGASSSARSSGSAAERREVCSLLWQLLGMVWQWRAELGPRVGVLCGDAVLAGVGAAAAGRVVVAPHAAF
jgi:hypothetical protein